MMAEAIARALGGRSDRRRVDGTMPRASGSRAEPVDHEAETQAFASCVVHWLNRNSVHSPPGRCLGCGAAEQVHDPLLPFGTETSGHAWLHSTLLAGMAQRAKGRRVHRAGGCGYRATEDKPMTGKRTRKETKPSAAAFDIRS